jgi:hypothetical protein
MAASVGLMKRVESMKFRMDTGASESDSYVEFENDAAARGKEKILVTGVKGVHSTQRIAQRMRDTRSVFLVSVKDMLGKDEFRPCIERIRKDCRDHSYDMMLVENEWIMLVPKDSAFELATE